MKPHFNEGDYVIYDKKYSSLVTKVINIPNEIYYHIRVDDRLFLLMCWSMITLNKF
jgi:hypothetical protein